MHSYLFHSEDPSACIAGFSLGICGPVDGKGEQTDTQFSANLFVGIGVCQVLE